MNIFHRPHYCCRAAIAKTLHLEDQWWVVESDARTHRTLRRCARNEAETSLFRESSPQDESVRPRTFGVRTRPGVAFESRKRPRTSDSGDCYFSSRKVTAPVSRL